tara:strand:- start:4880 stop:5239 length:360 start_codon:yes stop_codon:yes gene_type:complete
MKTFLVFNKIGEITEFTTKSSVFNLENFPEYKHCKRYKEYIILYNVEEPPKNLTVFYFTDDTYNSSVALLKANEDNVIKNLTYKAYTKQIKKIKLEPNDIIYSSEEESDIIDISPFIYN